MCISRIRLEIVGHFRTREQCKMQSLDSVSCALVHYEWTRCSSHKQVAVKNVEENVNAYQDVLQSQRDAHLM